MELKSTLIENEEEIQDKITQYRASLYDILEESYDSQTNELFNLEYTLDSYRLTELCEELVRIQSIINNAATYPPNPPTINSNALLPKTLNIKNKVQYCNNLLRYILRKNGISFNNNLNNMGDLINLIETIHTVKRFDKYVQNVEVMEDGDLKVTYVNWEDLRDFEMPILLYEDNGDIMLQKTSSVNDLYNELFLDVELDEDDGGLIITRVKDVWDNFWINKIYKIIFNDNNSLLRPSSVTIRLFVGDMEIDNCVVSETNDWTATFTRLPKSRNNHDINYSVRVDAVNGYTITFSDNLITLTK